jgi:hypothetical protein
MCVPWQGNHVDGSVDFDRTFRVHIVGHAIECSFVQAKVFSLLSNRGLINLLEHGDESLPRTTGVV